MKAVILAGGTGTRLKPLTTLMNKHMLPVGKHPMIFYGIDKLHQAGITEMLLVTGRQSIGLFASYLGSGRELGVSLTYRIQEEAGGIAEALVLARDFIRNDEKFIVLLGDNLFEDNLAPYVRKFAQQREGAMVLLKQVPDPHRYGIAVFQEAGQIAYIDEKPAEPQSDLCVTGIYMYDSSVFAAIDRLEPSDRGELEITDLNNMYARAGTLASHTLAGWWSDAGTFESLHEAAARLLKETGE
ncbi:sugar phosphate nucleotidyltransferase [Paenibacillus algorifonticola]|uniref:sugar phosphate nucleotidyltransferase n=1 Tax=Paenibacillus algorifonticola TaxID=684063 RepID=UPI003D2C7B92